MALVALLAMRTGEEHEISWQPCSPGPWGCLKPPLLAAGVPGRGHAGLEV